MLQDGEELQRIEASDCEVDHLVAPAVPTRVQPVLQHLLPGVVQRDAGGHRIGGPQQHDPEGIGLVGLRILIVGEAL